MGTQPPTNPQRPPLPDAAAGSGAAGEGFTAYLNRATTPGVDPGDRIGPYVLLERIGEGGFGEVWLAERREPMVQRVAIKVIKPGMDSAAVIARFEQERQALAVMDHPNVAKVFDGGMTERGRPYFVMEHVPGEPITTYCDRHRFTIRQRLELFVDVCDAVQHAHMKGIIHRDLKPGNILVTVRDDKAVAKVIDFGVAKAISRAFTDKTILTESGQIIGTPEYMSPEQAEMGALDIDTRADVYSLGVVLYELLAGVLPFDSGTLRAAGYAEIQRIIREEDPPRPSTRLATVDHGHGITIARARQADREHIAGVLRRELEWIPLKALRKDRARRYSSAESLAADIRRYLDGRPLEAAPESQWYLARKFVRRYRGRVTAAAAVLLALLFGLATTLWQRAEADRSRAAAEASATAEAKARARAETINRFVIKTLNAGDPREKGGGQAVTVLSAMDGAIRDLDAGRFQDDPETDATLRDTIATILLNNGRLADSEPLFARALQTRRQLLKGDHPDLVTSISNLALARQLLGRLNEAEPLCVEALRMNRALYEGDHPFIASSLGNLATVIQYSGRAAEAEPLFIQALDMRRRLFAGDSADVATSLSNLAMVRQDLGRPAEAEPLFIEALDQYRRLFPGDHPDLATSLNNLAYLRLVLRRAAEAEPMAVQALEMRRRLFAGDHPDIATSLHNLGRIRQALGRNSDAEPLYAESLEMRRRLYKGDHADIATSLNNLAILRQALGRADDAEPLAEEAVAMRRRLFPGDLPDTAAALANLARIRHVLGKHAEARAGFDEAVSMLRRLTPDGSAVLARVLWRSGQARQEAGPPAAALSELEEAVEMAARFLPADHPQLAEYRASLEACRAAIARPPGAT